MCNDFGLAQGSLCIPCVHFLQQNHCSYYYVGPWPFTSSSGTRGACSDTDDTQTGINDSTVKKRGAQFILHAGHFVSGQSILPLYI